MIIEGENLESLKLLLNAYREQVYLHQPHLKHFPSNHFTAF